MAEDDANLHLRLELVAPRGPVFEGDVDAVVVPAATGEIGILPRHAPLVALLAIGQMRALTAEGHWLSFAVAEGFVKVQFNKVIVLADTAEEASAIDVARAEESRKRALDRLSHPLADLDTARALSALKRAQARVETAAKK